MPPKKNRQDPAEDKEPDQQKQADESETVDDHAGNDDKSKQKGAKRKGKKIKEAHDPQEADQGIANDGHGRGVGEDENTGELAHGNAPPVDAAAPSQDEPPVDATQLAKDEGYTLVRVKAACTFMMTSKTPSSHRHAYDMLKAEKGVTPMEAIAQMDGSGPATARGAVPAETAGTQSVRPKRRVRIKLSKQTGAETVEPAAHGRGSGEASGAPRGRAIQGINVGPQNVAPKDWALYQKFRRADVQATIARVTAALQGPRHQELERARRENEKEKRKEAEKVKLRKEELKRHQEAILFAAAAPRDEVQEFPLPRPTGYRQPAGLGHWEYANASSIQLVALNFAGQAHHGFLNNHHPTPFEILMLRHAYREYRPDLVRAGNDPTSEIDIRWVPYVVENLRTRVPNLVGPVTNPPRGFEPRGGGRWDWQDVRSRDTATKRFKSRQESNASVPRPPSPTAADIWRLRQNRTAGDTDPVTDIDIVWTPSIPGVGVSESPASLEPVVNPPLGFEPPIATGGRWEFNDIESLNATQKFARRAEFDVGRPGRSWPTAADIWRLRHWPKTSDQDPFAIDIVWRPQIDGIDGLPASATQSPTSAQEHDDDKGSIGVSSAESDDSAERGARDRPPSRDRDDGDPDQPQVGSSIGMGTQRKGKPTDRSTDNTRPSTRQRSTNAQGERPAQEGDRTAAGALDLTKDDEGPGAAQGSSKGGSGEGVVGKGTSKPTGAPAQGEVQQRWSSNGKGAKRTRSSHEDGDEPEDLSEQPPKSKKPKK